MNKPGIRKIEFVDANLVDDSWVYNDFPVPTPGPSPETPTLDYGTGGEGNSSSASAEAESSSDSRVNIFASIDQDNAQLTEDLSDTDNGLVYTTKLDFTVRTEADMLMAERWARRPLVVYVHTVDGHVYTLGTPAYPVRFTINNKYDARHTREVVVHTSYDTLTGLLTE